jgi:hypothetical protein
MKFTPFPYQNPMVQWCCDRDRSALYATPGLGKTVVTLAVLDDLMSNGMSRGALIIAPVRVCAITWRNQAALWDHSSWMPVHMLRYVKGQDAWRNGELGIYLINPEQLPKITEMLFKKTTGLPVDTLVIDEISLAKNPTSVRFKSLYPYLQFFKQRIGLTGTPVPNSYIDLWAQIRLLDDGERLGRSFSHFRSTYFESDYMGYKWTLRNGSKEIIDQKLADLALVMLGSDYLDIPDTKVIDEEITLSSEARKIYDRMEKELLIELNSSEVVALTAATLTSKLIQLTGGMAYDSDGNPQHLHDAKLKALCEIRKRHLGEPLLVLTQFRHESARILQAIPGAEMFDERRMDDWQSGKIHTWVADPRSLSHGIDGLQASGRIAVWFSLTYSQEQYVQTNARLARTGQKHETLVYRIVCQNTIDDAVAEALRQKEDTQGGLLNALKALQLLRKQ